MKSYNDVFTNSKNMAPNDISILFNSFRDSPGIYHFLTAKGKYKNFPDTEAIKIGQSIDLEIFNLYYNQEKPKLGYATASTYVPIDSIDSRHMMMSTIIVNYLGRHIKKIVEIGGGFGNWVRINYDVIDFESWSIIDLDFVIPLQQWYLKNTIADTSKIIFEDANTYTNKSFYDIDLVIGAHSLSEIDFDIFENYMHHVVKNSKFLFYSTHINLPSCELVNEKFKLLEKYFDQIVMVPSENGLVKNIIFKNKNASN
jgi:hypothetical protein